MMSKSQTIYQKDNLKNFYYLASIIVIGIAIRLYYFPNDIPLIIDSLEYFLYASDTLALGHLPESWITINNGWPIFLSFWFEVIPLEETNQYMELQRGLSIVLSSLTAIPIFYLCKRFVDAKYAIIGAALFVIEPRIILNSILAINESLYILLGASSLVLLLKNERKMVFLSFTFAAFCTIVRAEGIFLFFAIIIIFLIQNKFTKYSLTTIIPSLGIFFLILSPIMMQRIEITGNDGIFVRATAGAIQTSIATQTGGIEKITLGIELFFKFFIWVLIPNFILFVPFGIIQYFRKVWKKENFIIIFLVAMSIPALYAYTVPAQDTRYLYFMFPVLCILATIAIKEYSTKIKQPNYLLIIIFCGIIIASVGFYEFKKDDWRMNEVIESERIKISNEIIDMTEAVNHHPTLGRYIKALQIPSEWPIYYDQINYKTNSISVQERSLNEFIEKNQGQLTHIITDTESNLPEFLKDVHNNNDEYKYLELIYNSKQKGYTQEFKVFRINYDMFENNQN